MCSSIKVSTCSQLNRIFKNVDDVCINQLAENEAIIMAEHVLDGILQQAAKYEYEKYIQPKIKPFAALSVTTEQMLVTQVRMSET